jgi:hypothetical protein
MPIGAARSALERSLLLVSCATGFFYRLVQAPRTHRLGEGVALDLQAIGHFCALQALVERPLGLAEEALQVDLDESGARQAGVVAHQAQAQAVADQAPEALPGRVQVLLDQAVGGAAAPVLAKADMGVVETQVVGGR